MARFTEQKRSKVDALIDRWRSECLVEDGSLLFDEPIWTGGNVDLLIEHFVENPLEDDDDFRSKLKRQLGDQPREVVRLMAETIAVYLAFAVTTVGPARKRELIGDVLAFKGDELASDSDLAKAMDGGIGGPGQGYNSYRAFLLVYLVRFARALKALERASGRSSSLPTQTRGRFANGWTASSRTPKREPRRCATEPPRACWRRSLLSF